MAYNTTLSTQSSKNERAQRNIRYIDRDFDSYKNSLIEFSKTYFPTTYADFSPSSPGMMFMEMAAYVGDVLSFYQDNQIQETFTHLAKQTPNIYHLAYMMGYTPKVTGAAVADIEIFQVVNANGGEPDYSEAVSIPSNTKVNSSISGNSSFVIQDLTDFSVNTIDDPTEVSVYSVSGGSPTSFLLKKKRKAVSATIESAQFTFGSYKKFPTVNIQDNNIIGIISCTDSNGNTWYEVPYLGQDTVYLPQKNTGAGENYLLKLLRTNNRFATRFIVKNQLQIQFGAGNSSLTDSQIIPDPSNVGKLGINLNHNTAFSPANFTFTNTYGTAPAGGITLTFNYLKGGGISSNAPANSLTGIDTTNITGDASAILTVACNNPEPATGGHSGDSVNEIKENSLRMFGTQLRSVTQDDYTVRALRMPGIYGSVAKIYVEPEKIENLNPHARPAVLDMYVLGYDNNKKLTTTSNTFKENLSTYLSQFRMVNDTVNIKDGFVVNIGVDFTIVLRPNYAGNVVLTKCINVLKDYFSIDKWQINQPIFVSDVYVMLDQVEGVQTVKSVDIYNKAGESSGYSKYYYDVRGATQNNTVYPSQDPSIFEVKYPNSDIRGAITNL